ERGERLLEALLVDDAVGDVDLRGIDAVMRRATVVAGELDARRRVRVARHLVAGARGATGDGAAAAALRARRASGVRAGGAGRAAGGRAGRVGAAGPAGGGHVRARLLHLRGHE